MVSDGESTRLYRIRKTVMEMLRNRGYLVGDFEINMSKMEFMNKYAGNLRREDRVINKANKDNSTDQIYVIFTEEYNFGVHAIRAYINRMKSENAHRAQSNLGCSEEAELLVNIKEHVLVPEYQVLTDTEKKTLLERYSVKETQLPKIQVTDPVARYCGLRRGQVVKIIRPSETAGRYVTYRYVT